MGPENKKFPTFSDPKLFLKTHAYISENLFGVIFDL